MNSEMDIREGDWVYVLPHQTTGKVIEKSCLWENISFRVWLPSTDSIVRVHSPHISSTQSSVLSPHHLSYIAAAARIADALTHNLSAGQAGVLLAPIESSVIPLPHQIKALSRAISSDRIRYLLADEVGLGKTIEAGLIMRELKLRGQVKRTLVIAPKGLVTQWVDGRSLLPTARHIWEQLLTISPPNIKDYLSGEDASLAFLRVSEAAEVYGKNLYEELLQKHRNRLSKEREKGEYAFTARKRIIERVGLPAVRSHRLAQLEMEEREWKENLERKSLVAPEMLPLLLVRLDGSITDG